MFGDTVNEIEKIYVKTNNETFTLSDLEARQAIIDLDDSLGPFAKADNLSKSDVTSALNYDPQAADNDIRLSFQAGVNSVYNAVYDKGVTPASKSLEDIVTAIGQIETGGNYMTKEIREDGIYHASDDGVDAYDVVVVNKDVGQPHTVIFYDKDGSTILKTQMNVPYHGYASCTILDGTFYNGQYFKGQNPQPVNVIQDLECYPIYGDYIITPEEIQDDQETICGKKGAGYPLGSHKALVLANEIIPSIDVRNAVTGETITVPSKTCSFAQHMYKVAEGEDGSTSTWLSYGNFTVNDNSGMPASYGNVVNNTSDTWGTSMLKQWLEGAVFQILPQCIQDNIITVDKVSQILLQGNFIDASYPSKLWIPSARENKTLFDSVGKAWYVNSRIETSGIDYSSILLSYQARKITRTICRNYADQFMGSFYGDGSSSYSQYESCLRSLASTSATGDGYQIGFCL